MSACLWLLLQIQKMFLLRCYIYAPLLVINKKILNSFQDANCSIHILIATIEFGMRVDSKSGKKVISFGPSIASSHITKKQGKLVIIRLMLLQFISQWNAFKTCWCWHKGLYWKWTLQAKNPIGSHSSMYMQT